MYLLYLGMQSLGLTNRKNGLSMLLKVFELDDIAGEVMQLIGYSETNY